MKKGLTLALGTVFLLGSAASALATHGDIPAETSVVAGTNAKITIDGALRMRGTMQKATTKDEKNSAWYDGRIRLGVKAELSDAASGYIQLENGANSGDNYTWGNGASAGLHTGGDKTAGALNVLQSWINYKPGKFGVKVGHMPLALGNKIFFDHTGSGDDAIQVYRVDGGTVIAALAIKFEENSKADNGNDINGYVALISQKLGNGMHVGANLTHLRYSDGGMAVNNLGVDFSGKFGPASVKADVEYQFGDWAASGASSNAKGYAVMVDGTMAAGPANVGLMIGYGSGDDNATDEDNDAFVNFLTDTHYDSYMVGYRFAVPGGSKNTGLTNLTMIKIHADIKTTCPITGKDLKINAAINYMKLNKVATGWDDSVGTELSTVATWKLSNGLSYKIEAAYLLAGDAYKLGVATADPDNSWFLRNGLELKF